MLSYRNAQHRQFLTHKGQPFKNVHSIIEDKQGDIWLGGSDPLLLRPKSSGL
ncbi:two-component regulator propeller domain-containing protein [Sphingobacterium thalpophilum]|uniref:two-component regulator propeller domain-containing protein n=1 Tax=Sphingobacterium thalpophilum TaxID=259 RepID=UPI003DA44B79